MIHHGYYLSKTNAIRAARRVAKVESKTIDAISCVFKGMNFSPLKEIQSCKHPLVRKWESDKISIILMEHETEDKLDKTHI